MGTLKTHKDLYLKFKKDALKNGLYQGTRVEAYFLSAFHLIEACAARERIHINKHQEVRSMLEKEDQIFEKETEKAWRAFQKIENQLRPKFAYSLSWEKKDLKEIQSQYEKIEKICQRKLENA